MKKLVTLVDANDIDEPIDNPTPQPVEIKKSSNTDLIIAIILLALIAAAFVFINLRNARNNGNN